MKRSRKEIQLVLRAQSGDADAMDSLVKAIQKPIYYYIVSLVNDEHLAYDVLQEVFLLVFRKVYWLRDARAFRPWVYRIASREAFRCLRQERHEPGQSDDPRLLDAVEDEPNLELTDPEMAERLTNLLVQVSPSSRAVLSLHYLNGMSLQEVSDILEISVGTVKSRLSYGLSTLRKELSKDYRDAQC